MKRKWQAVGFYAREGVSDAVWTQDLEVCQRGVFR
jgi:hypothetical protein